MTDDERAIFLQELDDAVGTVNVADWEAKFIESNLNREMFTDKQREVIDRMVEKYDSKL